MSVSSVGSSNPYSYLKWPPQPDGSDPTADAAPSDPLQALFQAATGGGNSGDPLLAVATQDDGSTGSGGSQPFSPDVMKALLAIQGSQSGSGASKLDQLFGKFDTDGNGQISQPEFETAIGGNVDKSKVDELYAKLDGNGDGSVSEDELKSALQKAHGAHHRHGHAGGADQKGVDALQSLLSGTSADGTTSQSATNSDGSSTTTITYADGTKVELTTPAQPADAGTSATSINPEAPNFANLLKQLINLQAQLVAPTTNLSA